MICKLLCLKQQAEQMQSWRMRCYLVKRDSCLLTSRRMMKMQNWKLEWAQILVSEPENVSSRWLSSRGIILLCRWPQVWSPILYLQLKVLAVGDVKDLSPLKNCCHSEETVLAMMDSWADSVEGSFICVCFVAHEPWWWGGSYYWMSTYCPLKNRDLAHEF